MIETTLVNQPGLGATVGEEDPIRLVRQRGEAVDEHINDVR